MSFRVRQFPSYHRGFVFDLGLVKATVTLVENEDAQLEPPKKKAPVYQWQTVKFDVGLLGRRFQKPLSRS